MRSSAQRQPHGAVAVGLLLLHRLYQGCQPLQHLLRRGAGRGVQAAALLHELHRLLRRAERQGRARCGWLGDAFHWAADPACLRPSPAPLLPRPTCGHSSGTRTGRSDPRLGRSPVNTSQHSTWKLYLQVTQKGKGGDAPGRVRAMAGQLYAPARAPQQAPFSRCRAEPPHSQVDGTGAAVASHQHLRRHPASICEAGGREVEGGSMPHVKYAAFHNLHTQIQPAPGHQSNVPTTPGSSDKNVCV